MASRTTTLLTALCLTLAYPAAAEPTATQKETARGLMQTGDQKYAAGDYLGALKAYEGAHALVAVPTTAVALARAHASVGHFVEALDAAGAARRYPKRADEPEAFTVARQEAIEIENDLVSRVSRVHISVLGTEAETPLRITVDGVSVAAAAGHAVRVNPGERVVGASAPGYHAATKTIVLTEGGSESIELVLEPNPDEVETADAERETAKPSPVEPTAPPPNMDWAPYMYTGFAVGGAGLLVGVISGAVAIHESTALEDACGGKRCPVDRADDVDAIDTFANVSNVGFVFAALGAGVGVVALVLDLQQPAADTAIRVDVGPGYLRIGGQF